MARAAVIAVVACLSFAWASGDQGLGSLLADLFVPRTPLTERFQRVYEDLSGRFPFSVAAALREWSLPVGEAGIALEGSVGPFSISLGYFAPLASVIRNGMGVLIMLSVLWMVANRLVPVIRI